MMQRNWIGKSVGGEITFELDNGESFTVFTTRADTLYGCTYAVLAPEHPLTLVITSYSIHYTKLYEYKEKLGFAVIENSKDEYGEGEDRLVMQKEL